MEAVWGIDLVIRDPNNVVRGYLPVAVIGASFESACARLKLNPPQIELNPGLRVSGIRQHINHLGHLFGKGAPYDNAREALTGPAVPIGDAYRMMQELAG